MAGLRAGHPVFWLADARPLDGRFPRIKSGAAHGEEESKKQGRWYHTSALDPDNSDFQPVAKLQLILIEFVADWLFRETFDINHIGVTGIVLNII